MTPITSLSVDQTEVTPRSRRLRDALAQFYISSGSCGRGLVEQQQLGGRHGARRGEARARRKEVGGSSRACAETENRAVRDPSARRDGASQRERSHGCPVGGESEPPKVCHDEGRTGRILEVRAFPRRRRCVGIFRSDSRKNGEEKDRKERRPDSRGALPEQLGRSGGRIDPSDGRSGVTALTRQKAASPPQLSTQALRRSRAGEVYGQHDERAEQEVPPVAQARRPS